MNKDILFVIDMQNAYTEGMAWYCKNINICVRNILKLLEIATQSDARDVIFTKFIAPRDPKGAWVTYNTENAAINADEYANDIIDSLQSFLSKNNVYVKSQYSALSAVKLYEEISNRSDARIVVTGVVAECCVLSTVMDLIDMGIPVIYLTDAVAGIDDVTEKAVLTILEGMAPIHVRCMTTQEYVDEFMTNSN